MSLRWRISLGFALVALATAAVIALATPPIVSQGFSDYDNDNDARPGAPAPISSGVTPTLRPIPTPSAEERATEPEAAEQSESATGAEGAEGDDGSVGASSTAQATPRPSPRAIPAEKTAATPAQPPAVLAQEESSPVAPDSNSSPAPTSNPDAEQATILRLIAAALLAALAASLVGLFAASRLVAPLTRLETAARGLARGDLSLRSGLAGRTDEFGQLGRTFDSMAGQLEEAEASRRRFLQDAAHELKTPLAVIEATSSAIIDGVYPAELRHLETIRDQSRALARIVNDLRTISLAEGGNLPLEKRSTDVASLLRSVAAAFGARAAQASIDLRVDSPVGLTVDADPDRLGQIVGALVDNAIRYVKPGGRIELSAEPVPPVTASAAARVRIAVSDDGPGFPPEALGRVFERFYQADPSRTRGAGTSGLGLSIVKAIAEAHGGAVGADNRPEGGARIWVELPASSRSPSGKMTLPSAGAGL